MKFLLVFSLTFVTAHGFYTKPGEVTDQSLNSHRLGRIASGQAPPKGKFLDFCYISVNFFQKQQTCGCVIISENYVATTARCVFDCSELDASNVTVTFPFKSGKDAVVRVSKITIPSVDPFKYDPTMDTPNTKFSTGNAAILELETPIKIDGVTAASLFNNIPTSLPQNRKFFACGVGIINNKRERPAKGVLCTEINLINFLTTAECKPPNGPSTEPYELPAGYLCAQWPDRDNNLCFGDYGGPVYMAEIDPTTGAITNYFPIGLAVGSPDTRPAAPCLDGHTVFIQSIDETMYTWLENFLSSLILGKSSLPQRLPWFKDDKP